MEIEESSQISYDASIILQEFSLSIDRFFESQISAYQQYYEETMQEMKEFRDNQNQIELDMIKELKLEPVLINDKEIIIKGEDLPINAKQYIQIARPIAMFNLEQRKELKNYTGDEMFSKETYEDKLALIKELLQNPSQNQIKDNYKEAIFFAFKQIQLKFGNNFQYLRLLNFSLYNQKEFSKDLVNLWCNARISIQEGNQLKEEKMNKIYPYRYNGNYCMICYLFNCSIHCLENKQIDLSQRDIDLDEQPQYGYYRLDHQENQNNLQFVYFSQSKEVKIKLKTFQCENFYACYRNGNNQESRVFKKFVKQFIFYNIKKFQCNNPCFISQLLGSEFGITCREIKDFIDKQCQYLIQPKQQVQNKEQIKKSKKKVIKNRQQPKKVQYIPCDHPGPCKPDICECAKNLTKCQKFCKCDTSCPHMFHGCKCKYQCQPSKCECIINGFECDPDTCFNCGADSDPKPYLSNASKEQNTQNQNQNSKRFQNYCHNTNILYNIKRRLMLGRSTICNGFGLFAGENFKKGDYIGEYVGETVLDHDAQNLSSCQGLIQKFYQFSLDDELVLDAISMGNKTRFINHGIAAYRNVDVRTLTVAGSLRIGFYASCDIQREDELFFDYGENFITDWIDGANKAMLEGSKLLKFQKRYNKVQSQKIVQKNSDFDENIFK